MRPYPTNNIQYKPVVPQYIRNPTAYKDSRYSIYLVVDNLNKKALEVRLSNSISKNLSYNGYYYTTLQNETLYSIAKKYYNDESFYWILAKANGIKDKGLSIIPKNTTIIVPNYSELQKDGGYFTANNSIE